MQLSISPHLLHIYHTQKISMYSGLLLLIFRKSDKSDNFKMRKIKITNLVSFFGTVAFVSPDQTSSLDHILEPLDQIQVQNGELVAKNDEIQIQIGKFQAENNQIRSKNELLGQKVQLCILTVVKDHWSPAFIFEKTALLTKSWIFV